jgi:squalene-hopene/tetraprenyl-beta-curcumene cyclase
MTYAGLKSMIYAGLDENDPRAKAATEWARKHYTVSENPGLGDQGLFYYYQTFAKALDAMQVDQLEDASGTKHDWRADLASELLRRQNENGSWVNSADRFYEGDPNLVTAYVLMALNRVQPPKK